MAHMNTLRAIYSEDLRGLICHITSLDANSPEVKRYEDVVLSNVAYRSYPTISKRGVITTIEGFVDKFRTHGFPEKARNLRKLVDRYTQCDYFRKHAKNELAQWSVLSVLVQLSYKPTDVLHDDDPVALPPERQLSSGAPSESEFDWPAYLRQGSENFRLPSSSSDDDSIWEMSDDGGSDASPAPPAPPLPPHCRIVPEVGERSDESAASGRPVALEVDDNGDDSSGRQRLVAGLRELGRAEAWLRDNVQLGWWDDVARRDAPPSPHPVANLFFLWEDAVCSDPSSDTAKGRTRVLTEYKVTREIVWLLSRPCDSSIISRVADGFRTREDVSVSSLSPAVFSRFLDAEVCRYLPMVESLNRFQSEVRSKRFGSSVPDAYLSYSVALGDLLANYTDRLSEVESVVGRQEGAATLLYVVNEMRPWLRNIEFIYQLHKEAVSDNWTTQENWVCAVRLVTVSFNRVAGSISDWEKKAALRLFLGAFRPYSQILGTWLGETRLVDYKDEYFITRPPDATREGNLILRDYKGRLSDAGIRDTSFLDSIVNIAYRAVSSIEFLVQFEKDDEVRRECLPCGALFDDFVARLCDDLVANSPPAADNGEANASKGWSQRRRRNVVPSLYRFSADDESPGVVGRLDFLQRDGGLLYSRDFYECGGGGGRFAERAFDLYTGGSTEVEYELGPVELLFESLKERDVSTTPVVVYLVREAYDAIVGHMRPRGFAGHLLLGDYGLGSHLEALRSVYLLQSGRTMLGFTTQLFKEMQRENLWSVGWTERLADLLEEEMPRHSARFSVFVLPKSSSDHISELACANFIELHYQPGSPLHLIITEPVISEYNKFFQFFLQLKWSLHTLQKLSPKDFADRETLMTRRLFSMRIWLLHTVSVLHAYLMCVPASSFEERIARVCHAARDLQTIVAAYREAIESWKRHCFLTETHPCRSTVQKVFGMCERLRLLWCLGRRNLLGGYQLDAIELNYQETIGSLANAVQDLEANEGSSVFGILHDDLVNNIPISLSDD